MYKLTLCRVFQSIYLCLMSCRGAGLQKKTSLHQVYSTGLHRGSYLWHPHPGTFQAGAPSVHLYRVSSLASNVTLIAHNKVHSPHVKSIPVPIPICGSLRWTFRHWASCKNIQGFRSVSFVAKFYPQKTRTIFNRGTSSPLKELVVKIQHILCCASPFMSINFCLINFVWQRTEQHGNLVPHGKRPSCPGLHTHSDYQQHSKCELLQLSPDPCSAYAQVCPP